MKEKLFLIGGALILWSSVSMAQEPPPPPPPGGGMPHIVVAPPPETSGPEGVEMTGDPVVDVPVVVSAMFAMMDVDGNGELSREELEAWIMHVHIPPMMGLGPDGCDDGGCGGEGVSVGMEGTEDLPEPECSFVTQEAEMSPVAENVSCVSSEAVGNLVHRTVCNVDEFRSQAISLPAGRAVDCFDIVALRGNNIEFEIVNEADGTVIFDTSMGAEAFRTLMLTGAAVYRVNLISADEGDAGLTVEFIDHPMF